MANIIDKTAQIREAVYGKDVREKIASGIEAINTEVENTTGRQTQLESDMAAAKADAIQATADANTARDLANTAADNANTKATLADEKAILADQKATLADEKATAAQTATDNANTTVANINNNTLIIYKPWVNTFADIATTYLTPELGWTTQTKDTFTRYRFNGTEWVNIGVFTDDKIGDMGQISESNLVQAVLNDRSQLAQGTHELLVTQNKLKPKTIKPIITFSFDDGTIYDYSDILPLFNSKGIVGTTGIIHDKIATTNYMTQLQIEAMKNAGWEIASHSKTHSVSDFTTLTQAQLEIELKDSKELLNNLGLDVKNLLIPYGFTNDNIAKTAAKYYRSMRVSGNGTTGTLNVIPIDTFRLNSLQLGDSTGVGTGTDSAGNVIDSLAQWKYWVDQAIATNSWLVFISHSNNVAVNYNRMADLSALIDYIQSLNLDIMTIDEALNTFENQVDTDKFKVGADGKISGEYGKVRYAPADTVLNATALSSIEVAQTTVNVITAGNSSGFVSTSGGTIQTIKPDNEPRRAYQLGKGYGNKQPLYLRDFASDGTPTNWRLLENIINHDDGSLASSHNPTALTRYAVNVCYIPQANSSGYPENVAGFLTAWFFNDYGSCYEEYKIRNSDKVYARYWDAVGSAWSAWSVKHYTTSLIIDSLNASSLLTTFPYGVSYLQITSGNSTGMPSSNAWLLETRRTSPNGFNYQFAHLYDSTATYKRVAKADGTWSAWAQVNA